MSLSRANLSTCTSDPVVLHLVKVIVPVIVPLLSGIILFLALLS